MLYPSSKVHIKFYRTLRAHWLTFTTRWILIDIGSYNLTALVEITSSMIYRPTYQSTRFFAGLSLNTKSFVLNMTLSSTFYTLASFLPLSAYLFISFCTLTNTALASSCTFLILSTNFVIFSIFSFLLKSILILNSLP